MSRIAPQTEAEAAEAIRSQDGPLTIVGNGSRLALGADTGAPEISAGAMRGVVDYQPAALSLVVRAGTTMDEIAATLAAERQRLPFEPTDHRVLLGDGAPTIGGTVAGNHSGPRRIRDGACRDALLGVRMVNGRGEIVKSGGKVMKNVTGLDLVKLAAGSWGGLGLMTEFCFRTQPLPEMTATLRAEGLTEERAVAALCAALGSPYDVTGAAHVSGGATLLRLEGFADSVAHRAGALRSRLAAFGDWALEDDQAAVAAEWADIRDAKAVAAPDGAIWRISVRPTDGPKLLAALRARIDVAAAAMDWSGGLIWLRTAAANDLPRNEAARLGGHAALIRADAAMRARFPALHPEPPLVAALSARVAAAFDPAERFKSGVIGFGDTAPNNTRGAA